MSKPKKITRKDGTTAYRVVFDVGTDPVTGKRKQKTMTFDRQKDALAELARVKHQRATGTYVAPSKDTVNDVIDAYLATACFEKEAATVRCYHDAFRCVRERLGERQAQSLARADGEALRDWMLTSGRKIGGKAGTGLGPRSVRLTLGMAVAAFDQAVEDGRLTRNPFRGVKPPRYVKRERDSWSEDEAKQFIAEASRDRLHAAWRLALWGERREEILGARWDEDVDLEARTLTIQSVRVLVAGMVVVKDTPKSVRSARTLLLDDDLTEALKALHVRQSKEKLAAGAAYRDSGYVVVDELGEPVHPDWFSDEFERVVRRAKVRRITLHEARHSINSLMEKDGVADSTRAAHLGHRVDTNRGTYTHALPADRVVARDSISRILKIG